MISWLRAFPSYIRRNPHVAVFFLSLSLSLGVLPRIAREDTYPLFDWRLFDKLRGGEAFDLVVARPDQSTLVLSDGPLLTEHARGPAWQQVQTLGQLLSSGLSPHQERGALLIATLTRTLNVAHLKPIRLIRLRVPLYEYLNPDLSPVERLALGEAVYDF